MPTARAGTGMAKGLSQEVEPIAMEHNTMTQDQVHSQVLLLQQAWSSQVQLSQAQG